MQPARFAVLGERLLLTLRALFPVGGIEMTNSSLVRKLKIKPGLRIVVINPPAGYSDELGSLPEGVELSTNLEGQFDFIHLFVQNSGQLEQHLPLVMFIYLVKLH